MNRVAIFGCGYVGSRVAQRHIDLNDKVTGFVRTQLSVERLEAIGIKPALLDLDASIGDLSDLEGVELYYFTSPPKEGETDPRVERLIHGFRQAGHPRRVVYISTTGVYGDCGGMWVDETRSLNPQADRAKRRVAAEERWRKWSSDSGGELVILRVAGIYGPGHLPLKRIQKGLPLLNEEEAPYTNRIHVDDLVKVCVASMGRAKNGAVFNVSDGHPSTMVDYFFRIADLYGLPRPPLINRQEAEQQLSKGMLGYMNESRRLSNDKMLEELGLTLDYPDLQTGLPACIEQGE